MSNTPEIKPFLLDQAPPPKGNNRNILVLGCGLGSTAATLVGVYLLNHFAEINPMGWYADNILPIGAMIVGLAASIGYVFMAWLTGLKVRRGLLVAIVLLQVGAYFAAQYTEFLVQGPFVDRDTKRVIMFPEYFHIITTHMAWKEDGGKLGHPLGNLGYLLRLGELVGFSLGAILPSMGLLKAPYCELCEQYMKSKSLALVPASNTKAGHLFGKRASTMTAQEVMESGMTDVVELVGFGTANDAAGFADKLAALAPLRAQAKKLSRRIEVRLVSCGRCAAGHIKVRMTETHGRNTTTTQLGQTEVSQPFIRELRDRKLV